MEHLIGEIFEFHGTFAPAGTLPCLGQSISRFDYPALFNVIAQGDDFEAVSLPNKGEHFYIVYEGINPME